MPYSPIPYYPPGERILTQAEIDENMNKLVKQQEITLKNSIGPHLFTFLQSMEDTDFGKIRENQ